MLEGGLEVGAGVFFGVGTGVLVGVGTGVFFGAGTGVFFGVGTGLFFGAGTGVFVGVGTGVFFGVGTGVFFGVGTGVAVGGGPPLLHAASTKMAAKPRTRSRNPKKFGCTVNESVAQSVSRHVRWRLWGTSTSGRRPRAILSLSRQPL